MKDLEFCRICRLISAFGREYGKKKFKNIYVRSRNVYENKQIYDKMPGKKQVFFPKFRTFSVNRHEFCGNSGSIYDETTESTRKLAHDQISNCTEVRRALMGTPAFDLRV
jgi:hypothetical protein